MKTLLGTGKVHTSECVEVAPGGFAVCEVVYCPFSKRWILIFKSKSGLKLLTTSLDSQIKTAQSTFLALD